jgi:hypothetical protein
LPGDEKQNKVAARFERFFNLPPQEQEQTIEALPEGERVVMENTLQLFGTLPPEQRKLCSDSFERFSRMSNAQRAQFLKNAERWKAMSPKERETWRTLVKILPPATASAPPPLPPGAGLVGNGATDSNSTPK